MAIRFVHRGSSFPGEGQPQPVVMTAEPGGLAITGADVQFKQGGGVSPFFEEDFSTYTLGNNVVGGGANGFSWTSGNGDGRPVVVECPWDTDQRALRFRFDSSGAGDGHLWQEQRWNHGRNLQELWLEFDVYHPDGTEPDGEGGMLNRYEHNGPGYNGTYNNKFLALWADSYNSEPVAIWQYQKSGLNSTLNLARTEGNRDGDSVLVRYPDNEVNSGADPMLVGPEDRGRWINIRVQTRVGDQGVSNGHHRLWIDGVLSFVVTNDPFYDEAGDNTYLRAGYLIGSDQSRFPVLTYIYVRDFRVWDQDPGWE